MEDAIGLVAPCEVIAVDAYGGEERPVAIEMDNRPVRGDAQVIAIHESWDVPCVQAPAAATNAGGVYESLAYARGAVAEQAWSAGRCFRWASR